MEIIKQGHVERKLKKYKFECARCGCVFISNENEIEFIAEDITKRYIHIYALLAEIDYAVS